MKGNKIRGAVLLRKALIRWRNLAAPRKLAAAITCALCPRDCRSFLSGAELSGVPKDVPRGHLAVYVGVNNCKRFVIPAAYLNHPLFVALLDKAEEEYGFQAQRRLTIPCDDGFFHYILHLIGRNNPSLKDMKLDEVVNSFLTESNCASQKRSVEGSNCSDPLIRHSAEQRVFI